MLTLMAAITCPALAQESGSISGSVRDVEGAPLAGVLVSVHGASFPLTTAHTRDNGTYRFAALPPAADYVLRFEIAGFQTLVQEDVAVRLGGDTQITPQLAIAGVTETVVVSGETPIVDVKDTGTGRNVTERYMQSIPSARDPWVMLQHTSGVQTDKPNVGGSESGRQQSFTSHGTKSSDTMWSYDGADLGLSGSGASPTYYDFDAFEEISISTGGNDASIQTGGVRLNFVTRRGGNSVRGSGRFYHTDGAWQGYTVGDPATGDLVGNYSVDELKPGYIGNSIDDLQDFGAELGGPIVGDRLFAWGAFGRQLINTFVGTTPDNTQLSNWHGKTNWHIGGRTIANFAFMRGSKTGAGRGASAHRPAVATWDQDGASPSYTFKLQQTLSDDHYFEASLNHFPSWWEFEPLGGRNTQAGYDLATGVWSNTMSFVEVTQRSTGGRADGSIYLSGARVDHEVKYGVSYREMRDTATQGWPGGVIASFWQGSPYEAWLVQDTVENNQGQRHGLYASDSLRLGRLTVNAGLRFDVQSAKLLPSAAGASELAPETFPAVSFPGYEPAFDWTALSPRLGLTYDLTGSAQTVLRLHAARYASQLRNWEFSYVNTVRGNEVDFEWFDLNGNSLVDRGETGEITWISPGFDPSHPQDASGNIVTETSPPWTNELIVGLEHEFSRTFGVGANFIYRKNGGFTWAPRVGEDDPSFWEPVVQNVNGYGELTVYQPIGPRSRETIYQTRDHYDETHRGIEIYAERRFADGWMANASFNYGNTIENYRGAGSYTDPTNIAFRDGRARSFGSRFGTWGAARWNLKLAGMVQLPAGISLAGFAQAREGGINPRTVLSNRRAHGAGRVDALVADFGTSRLPAFWSLDLRGEKTFDISGRGRLHLIADAFNVTNNDTILGREGRLNSRDHGRITDVLQGRTIRLGLRLVLR